MEENNNNETDELIKRIRRRKLQEEEEEEEEAARKRARRQQQDTEEDDENLREEDDDDNKDRKREDNDDDNSNDDDQKQKQNNDDQREQNTENKESKDKQDTTSRELNNNEKDIDKGKDNTGKKENNISKSSDSSVNNSVSSNGRPSNIGKEMQKSPVNAETGTGATTGGTGATGGAATGGTATAGTGATGGTVAGGAAAGGTAAGGAAAGGAAAGGTVAGGAAAGGAAAGGAAAGGAAAGAGAAAAPIVGAVIVVILVAIIVIGILFFFIAMPGMVIGRIGQAINDFRKSVDGFVHGSDYAKILVGKKEVTEAAQYLSQMGYDLNGYGFLGEEDAEEPAVVKDKISAKVNDGWWAGLVDWWNENNEDDSKALAYEDFSTKSASERKQEEDTEYHNLYLSSKYNKDDKEKTTKSKILLATTKDGEVKYAKSKYLTMYLTADNAVYLVRNYYTDFSNRLAKLIGKNDTSNGSGLISFVNASDVDVSKYVTGADNMSFANAEGAFLTDRVDVYRAYRVMRVYNSDDGLFKKTWYDYNMDGWASKYGIPLQLSLAMHLSSLAPEFAYEFAKIGAYETNVQMGLLEIGGTTIKMQLDLYLDGDNTRERYYLESTTSMRVHKDGNGNDEEGYETINEALDSEYADYDTTKDTEKQKSDAEKEMNKTLDDVENDLKQKTKEGTEKIKFGDLGYAVSESPDSIKWNELSQSSYYISVNKEDKYLKEFITALVDNNILYVDKDDNNRLKKKDGVSDTQLNKAKEIFTKYFKLTNVKDLLAIKDFNDYNQDVGVINKEIAEEKDKEIDDYEYSFSNTYHTGYAPGNPTGMDVTVTYTARRFSYDQVWEWYFLGTKNIEYPSNLLLDLFGVVDRHFPIRTYYKLVNAETGETYKFKEKDKDFTANDFVYIGGNTYYDDSDNTGEFWRRAIPKKIAKAILEAIGEPTDDLDKGASKVQDILSKMEEINTENFTKYQPMILEVKDHWYQDMSFEGAYEWDTSEAAKENMLEYVATDDDTDAVKAASDNSLFYTFETTQGSVKEVADAKKVGAAGAKVRELLKKKYYKYDGTGRSKEKSKVNFADSAVDAIAMLEQIQGEDAQDIIRMFRELMASYNIYFEEAKGTAEKKELFKSVIKDYENADDLLTDGDDCVYKADIPPAQSGFKKDMVVQSPCNGKITYRTDDSVCIEIDDKNGTFDKYTILISGFNVNESIKVGDNVQKETQLGKTIKQDLKLVLRDDKGAIVKNEYETIVGGTKTPDNGLGLGAGEQHEGQESNDDGDNSDSSIGDGNKDTRVAKRNPVYTKKQLESIFTKYNDGQMGKNLTNYSDAFYKLQTDYGVNPLFAAAVAIQEQAAGTANSSLVAKNNWFSIRSIYGGWKSYSSPAESIDDFGWTIAQGSNYYSQGKYTIEKIGKTYCVPPDHWIQKVTEIMSDLEKLK